MDIETVASQGEIPSDFLKIDARLKDEAKILAAKGKAFEKTVFDGGFGEVISIAYAINDQEPRVFYRTAGPGGLSERVILARFNMAVEKDLAALDTSAFPTLVGHNIQFDLGFLFKAFARHRIPFPWFLHWPIGYKDNVQDTQIMWAGPREYVSLDTLAYILLGVRKTMSGAEVGELWDDGEYQKIADYNVQDVNMTRAIHKILLQGDYPET